MAAPLSILMGTLFFFKMMLYFLAMASASDLSAASSDRSFNIECKAHYDK
jgi:hypothetical protein